MSTLIIPQVLTSPMMLWHSTVLSRKIALLSCGSTLFVLGRAIILSTIAIETSQRLFLGMIKSVFRAPLSFFDSIPSSRIINRSSTDQSIVDTDIAFRLAGLVFSIIQLLSVIALMCQAYYISSARELARMVPMQQAPILQHFSESIAGATLIRSFNQEDRFSKRNVELIDNYSCVAFYNFGTMEWLCVRINFLFNLVFFLLLVILVSLPRSAIDSSLAGLAATYGLNLNVLQAWVIWNICNVENKMISVERILQLGGIESEAPLIIDDHRPEKDWPWNGEIEVENLHVQYSPVLPRVLKGITCTFPGKSKIGVVGRKQNTNTPSLRNAMLLAIQAPLAINAVFAGINTIASYVGPLLITSFVNLLSTDDENLKWHHGLILALIFFTAKTVESLSQRQWYFGARRIGIRVRAGLMALIYKKSLAIKYGGTSSSSGKIINYVNVDAERMAEFCWHIHGIWLLPIQVTFALVILNMNLGAAPTLAAFLTTIFVMISNTPLGKVQEKLQTKIMEATQECLMKLLHDKTVVYVTHQKEFLASSDLVLVMKDGRIVESGKYQDLVSNPGEEFKQQMAAHHNSLKQINPPKIKDSSTFFVVLLYIYIYTSKGKAVV